MRSWSLRVSGTSHVAHSHRAPVLVLIFTSSSVFPKASMPWKVPMKPFRPILREFLYVWSEKRCEKIQDAVCCCRVTSTSKSPRSLFGIAISWVGTVGNTVAEIGASCTTRGTGSISSLSITHVGLIPLSFWHLVLNVERVVFRLQLGKKSIQHLPFLVTLLLSHWQASRKQRQQYNRKSAKWRPPCTSVIPVR